MEKASEPKAGKPVKKQPRGAKRDKDRITRGVKADVPKGSRFKGYKSILVRELVLAVELVHYRRACRAYLAPFIAVDDTRRPPCPT